MSQHGQRSADAHDKEPPGLPIPAVEGGAAAALAVAAVQVTGCTDRAAPAAVPGTKLPSWVKRLQAAGKACTYGNERQGGCGCLTKTPRTGTALVDGSSGCLQLGWAAGFAFLGTGRFAG